MMMGVKGGGGLLLYIVRVIFAIIMIATVK